MAGLPYIEYTDHIYAIGDPVHINEKSPYFGDWRGVDLWFAGLVLDRDGKVTFRVTGTPPEDWRKGSLDITDEIEPGELSAGHLDANGDVTGASHRLSLIHANARLNKLLTKHKAVLKGMTQVLVEVQALDARIKTMPEGMPWDPMGDAVKAMDRHVKGAAAAALAALDPEKA